MRDAAPCVPEIPDLQLAQLLAAAGDETIKEKRDRAILSTLLYHAARRASTASRVN
jgi:hypothetical protein